MSGKGDDIRTGLNIDRYKECAIWGKSDWKHEYECWKCNESWKCEFAYKEKVCTNVK